MKIVGYTGFEPVTSALSRQRSKPTELISPFFEVVNVKHIFDFPTIKAHSLSKP